jgi:hypothetical protein
MRRILGSVVVAALGELANARKMGDTGIYDFLSSHVATAH